MNPKAFVISLKDHELSQLMTADCLASAKQWNWNIEVWNGVDGSLITQDYWNHLGLTPTSKESTMKKPGVQGCFLSHWQLWNKCIELNEPIIILEHDAIIKDYWIEIDSEVDIVKLHPIYKYLREIDILGTWSYSAHAYYIKPQGAKKLIEFTKNNEAYPADVVIATNVVTYEHSKNELVGRNEKRASSTSQLENFRKL